MRQARTPRKTQGTEVLWLNAGEQAYLRTYRLQQELHSLRHARRIPDTVVVVEHRPCFTLGRAGGMGDLLASAKEVRRAGIRIYPTDRGGRVTYHGPGQLVCYPIMNLADCGKDVHVYARKLEEVMIVTTASFGVDAWQDPAYPGVWVAEGKIGAIGIRVRQWVTMHGVALNVSPEMSHFSLIVPCGINGHRAVSLEQVLGQKVDTGLVQRRFRSAFETVFDVVTTKVTAEEALRRAAC